MPARLVTVFGSSRVAAGDAEYAAAERCGRLLAEQGMTVATGGYGGTMEAVSRGADAAGGHVVGVTAPAVFPGRTGANPFVAEERPAATITARIHALVDPADACIALPGSIGTFTELVMAWNAAYLGAPRPLVAVGAEWRDLVGTLEERLAVPPGLVAFAGDVDEAVAHVVAALTG